MHELLQSLITRAEPAPLVTGHRGSAATHAENTLSSFEAAAATTGVTIIEFDVRQTADGEWVCIHDATTDRTTDSAAVFERADVRIDSCSLDQLRPLNAGNPNSPEGIPTLPEALRTMLPRTVPMIERKAGDPIELASLLRAEKVTQSVIVQSFDWDWLRAFHAAAPRIALGALGTGPLTPGLADEAIELGAELLHWDVDDLDLQGLQTMVDGRAMSCVYTADRESTWCAAAQAGIHAVVTNDPSRMVAARDAGRLAR